MRRRQSIFWHLVLTAFFAFLAIHGIYPVVTGLAFVLQVVLLVIASCALRC